MAAPFALDSLGLLLALSAGDDGNFEVVGLPGGDAAFAVADFSVAPALVPSMSCAIGALDFACRLVVSASSGL